MRPIQHRSANDVLGCQWLTTASRPSGNRTRVMARAVVSHWQPSTEQLALLNKGMPVQLSVWGRTHPPVALGVEGDGGLAL